MKRNFIGLELVGEIQDKNLPVLLISNHISWWDGFWAMYINEKLFQRRFHFMMLEEQLRKYWFFNLVGGFSVNKKSRSILETIDYSSELLVNPNNLVLIFPQGEIQSMHKQSFIFEKGVERILNKVKNPIQIVFLANLVDYNSNSRPRVYLYLQEYCSNDIHAERIQEQYNTFYKQCLGVHQQQVMDK